MENSPQSMLRPSSVSARLLEVSHPSIHFESSSRARRHTAYFRSPAVSRFSQRVLHTLLKVRRHFHPRTTYVEPNRRNHHLLHTSKRRLPSSALPLTLWSTASPAAVTFPPSQLSRWIGLPENVSEYCLSARRVLRSFPSKELSRIVAASIHTSPNAVRILAASGFPSMRRV